MCLVYKEQQFHTVLTIQVDIFGLQDGRMKWKVVIVWKESPLPQEHFDSN
jgi:hypothetical protein